MVSISSAPHSKCLRKNKENTVEKMSENMSLYDFILEDLAKLKGTTKYGHYRHKMLKLLPRIGFLGDAGYYPFGGCTVALEFTNVGVAIKYGVCNEVDRFVKSLGRACAKAKKPSQFYLYEEILEDILEDEECLTDDSLTCKLDIALTTLDTFRRMIIQRAYQKAEEGLKKAGFKEKTFYILK
jgi:hypothetical protein